MCARAPALQGARAIGTRAPVRVRLATEVGSTQTQHGEEDSSHDNDPFARWPSHERSDW